jgi:hypothetical protein
MLGILALATCTSGLAREYCQEACDCEGCSERELESCEIYVDGSLDAAGQYDCDAEADSYLECLNTRSRCQGDLWTDDGDCQREGEDLEDCIDRGSDGLLTQWSLAGDLD